MTIRVPNADETELSIRIAELLWDRRTRPMTVGDLLRLLYPGDDADRERQHEKVERGARLACGDMDWIVGTFPDGDAWFASPSVAKTMTPAPPPTEPEPAPKREPWRGFPYLGTDPAENRIRRALKAIGRDLVTVDELIVAAFPRMHSFRIAREAVHALGERAAEAMGWIVVEGGPAGPVFRRIVDAEDQPTFEEAT